MEELSLGMEVGKGELMAGLSSSFLQDKTEIVHIRVHTAEGLGPFFFVKSYFLLGVSKSGAFDSFQCVTNCLGSMNRQLSRTNPHRCPRLPFPNFIYREGRCPRST